MIPSKSKKKEDDYSLASLKHQTEEEREQNIKELGIVLKCTANFNYHYIQFQRFLFLYVKREAKYLYYLGFRLATNDS